VRCNQGWKEDFLFFKYGLSFLHRRFFSPCSRDCFSPVLRLLWVPHVKRSGLFSLVGGEKKVGCLVNQDLYSPCSKCEATSPLSFLFPAPLMPVLTRVEAIRVMRDSSPPLFGPPRSLGRRCLLSSHHFKLPCVTTLATPRLKTRLQT